MASEVDIALPSPRMVEVPQRGLYRLERRGHEFSAVHRISQERKPLPVGHQWSLSTTSETHRVFACSPTAPSIWMARHLRSSLWSGVAGDPMLLSMAAGPEGEPASSRWLDTMSSLHKADWIDITVHQGGLRVANTAAKVYIFDSPKDRAMVFWEIDSFRDIIGQANESRRSDWFRNTFRRRWWPWALACGVPAEHHIPGDCGIRSVVTEGMTVHRQSVSTFGLLVLLRKWAISLDCTEGRQRAMGIFAAILSMVPSPLSFEVRSPVAKTTPFLDEYVQVHVCDGKLKAADSLVGSLDSSDKGCGWPYTDITLKAAIDEYQVPGSEIAVELLRALSGVLEHAVVKKHTSSSDILSMVKQQNGFFIDPDVKAMMHKIGRSSFRTSKLCKSLQLRVAGNAHRQQAEALTKYWLAIRECFAQPTTVAMSVDATRFSGRDWQCGPICNVESQQFAWMPPVVLCEETCTHFSWPPNLFLEKC